MIGCFFAFGSKPLAFEAAPFLTDLSLFNIMPLDNLIIEDGLNNEIQDGNNNEIIN